MYKGELGWNGSGDVELFPLAHLGIPLVPLIIADRKDLDFRLLALGALLPDLIDKPLGHLVLPENNGRIIGHTLAFTLILITLGLYYRKLLPLSYGVVFHNILDSTFTDPRGTLWPFLGSFAITDFHVSEWLESLLDPLVLGWEIAGLISIIYFLHWSGILTKHGWRRFLKKGSGSEHKS